MTYVADVYFEGWLLLVVLSLVVLQETGDSSPRPTTHIQTSRDIIAELLCTSDDVYLGSTPQIAKKKVNHSYSSCYAQLCHCCSEGKVINKTDRDRRLTGAVLANEQRKTDRPPDDCRQNICKIALWRPEREKERDTERKGGRKRKETKSSESQYSRYRETNTLRFWKSQKRGSIPYSCASQSLLVQGPLKSCKRDWGTPASPQ